MPKAFPLEFRRDVVAVARKGEAPLSSSAFAASTYRTDPAPHAQGRFRLFRLLLRHADVESLAFTDPGSHPVLEPVRSHRKLDGEWAQLGSNQ